jgi:flagellar motor switch/type III secretory pathway protein FliN
MNMMSSSIVSVSEVDRNVELETKEQNSPELDPGKLLPWLPCTLALEIPVAKFNVRKLYGLAEGSLLETAYHQSSDLPLLANGQLVGWTEFEVVGDRLAVRLTDLS